MNAALKKALAEGDVKKILLQAAIHADYAIRRYIWRGYRPRYSSTTEIMVGDKTARDFVSEALRRLLEGVRQYDEARSLLENLNSVTDSLISSEKKSSDRTPLVDWTPQETEDGDDGDPIPQAKGTGHDPAKKTIEDEILEDQRRCFQALRTSFDGDKETQEYLDAMSQGYYKPADISELTGIAIKRVYQIRRDVKAYAQRFFGAQDFQNLQRILSEGGAK